MSITDAKYCRGEGRLELASRSYFQFALDIDEARLAIATGRVTVNAALLHMTSAGDKWGTSKFHQLQHCFETVAAGNCPDYPRGPVTKSKSSEV